VVRDGAIVAEGTNLVTSSNDPTAHAEVMAIRNACRALGTFDLDGCEMHSSCEPCPMCLGAIYWARIARVYHAATSADAMAAGFDDSRIYQELSKSRGERTVAMIRVRHAEALAAFEAWRTSAGRREY